MPSANVIKSFDTTNNISNRNNYSATKAKLDIHSRRKKSGIISICI